MAKNRLKRLMVLVLSTLMLLVAALSSGCSGTEGGSPSQTVVPGQRVEFITPQQASDLIEANQNNPNFIILDDRTTSKFDAGHIANATNMPYAADFNARLDSLDRDKIYLVYCNTGCGATSAAMRQLGFREVHEIEGGLDAWKSQGLPIE